MWFFSVLILSIDARNTQVRYSMSMRFILLVGVLSILGFGSWYSWEHVAPVRQFVFQKLSTNEFRTLEIRYSAEEIMETHKTELLKNQGYAFSEPKLLFYPYLLMDVKYSKGRSSTTEGIVLWGLNDGEMVVDTATWESTHGFEDCLVAKADKNDFKLLEVLAESGGALDREKIYRHFNVDPEVIDRWIESCREKKLVVISGNKYRLHFQNPHLQSEPITALDQPLVTLPTQYSHKIKGRYSPSQIKHFAQTAFGADFAMRRTQEVFLPVYSIAIQNPDGSTLTTYWNALNGQRFASELCR